MFAHVVHFHWKELLSAAYIGSIVLLLTAFAVFLLEQGLDNECVMVMLVVFGPHRRGAHVLIASSGPHVSTAVE